MKHLKYLNKFLWKYRVLLLTGSFFVCIANIFALYPAEFVRKAFDAILLENNNITYILIKYTSLIILFAILKGVFMYFMRQTIIVMSRKIEFDIKNEIYIQYQKLERAFYKKNKIGDLMNRISEDVSRIRMYVGPGLMYAINIVILFSLVLYKMFSINITLTLYVLIPLPILAITVYFVSNKINYRSERVQNQLSKLTTIAQETYSGIKLTKSFNNQFNSWSLFLDACKKYTQKQLYLVKIEAFFFPLIITLIGSSTILTVYVGGIESLKGNITTGNIAEFIIYINMLAWPVASIGWVTSLIQRAAASQERINNFLLLNSEIKNTIDLKEYLSGDIIFNNVCLTYKNTNTRALKNISLNIKEGKSLGIFGKTGSGKSTIANLICRFYDTTEGEIMLNKTNIKNLDLTILRSKIGYVPQDDYLFSGTIKENIIFGSDIVEEARIVEAIKNAEIFEEINNLSNGLETIIGERGVQLSGGQRQRLAIARALYKHSEIFILDDCLSAVDANKERKILENLKQLSKGKTNIIISHRISSIKHAYNIIVLDEGRIIEQGSHKDLLEKKGFYYTIYNNQSNKKA